jgi:RNA polymerase sigma-70 factor (ECF subfamily)
VRRRPDDDVVAGAKAGDPDAWRHLYRVNNARLRVWLAALPTGDAAVDADDLAAEAWLTASRRVGEFHGAADDFAGWLFTIARNQALTARARSRRRCTQPVDVTTGDAALWGSVADPAGTVEAVDFVTGLIRLLSRREAEVVACIDLAGFDVATTATILDVSEVAVRVATIAASPGFGTCWPTPTPSKPSSTVLWRWAVRRPERRDEPLSAPVVPAHPRPAPARASRHEG